MGDGESSKIVHSEGSQWMGGLDGGGGGGGRGPLLVGEGLLRPASLFADQRVLYLPPVSGARSALGQCIASYVASRYLKRRPQLLLISADGSAFVSGLKSGWPALSMACLFQWAPPYK